MKKEIRTVRYDNELCIEAYHFQGIMQKFPNHFHEYYVIGFVERGQRLLSCKNTEYIIGPGHLLMFNPHDSHTCEQIDGRVLDYRCINIHTDIMKKAVFEITGKEYLPYFIPQVVFDSEFILLLKESHLMILSGEKDFRKEEVFFFLLENLIEKYASQEISFVEAKQSDKIKAACEFLEKNYMINISLNDLSNLTGLSKYHFLRTFTKQRGISPYSYLETIRISKAKKLMEEGVSPLDAALHAGFTDQSHFTNFFKKFIGLTPRQYMNIFKDKD